MPVENSLSFKGLVTSPNNLGAGSEGALVVANNVTIRYPDVLEPRRGQEEAPTALPIAYFVMSAYYQPSYSLGSYYSISTSKDFTVVVGQQLLVSVGDAGVPFEVTVAGPIQIDAEYIFFRVYGDRWPADAGRIGPFTSYYNRVFKVGFVGQFPVSQLVFFQDKALLHSELAKKAGFSDASEFLFGDYSAADPAYRLKTATSASTLYMATDKGVMALEQASSTVPRLSGIAEPLKFFAGADVDPTSPAPTIRGFLAPEKAVAYRVLFGYVDSHNVPHFGPPSVRVTIRNASTTEYATGRLVVPLYTVPTDAAGTIVSGTFVRVYRSVMADTEALTSDELYLVNETVIDTAQYTTSSTLTLSDTTRQEFAVQSAPLYTNATQGGLPNDPPPFARDLANWDSRLWFANTEQPYSLTAQLVGVGGGGNPDIPATGIRPGDTLTIAGVVFTAWGASIPSERKFAVWGSGSAAVNISVTLEQLQDVVNDWHKNNPSFDIWAYLEPVVFGDQLLNFKIRFQRPSVDSTANTQFNITYTVGSSSVTNVSLPLSFPYAGQQAITLSSALDVRKDDWVQLKIVFPSSSAGTYDLKVTSVSGSLVRVDTTTLPSGPVISGALRRLYGESVWTPDLIANSSRIGGSGPAAENERRENGLYYSLPGEPEVVSAASYLTVGTSGRAIKRIVPQRDRLLVFKEEGTYAVYGDFPYQVSLIDDTVQILAPDSAVALGSTVFVLTDDGILAITDGGIQMISKVIDSTLKPYLASTGRNTTATGAFGVSYESEKVFALYMPALGVTGYEAKAYVYGLESGAWTTWTFDQARICGRVDPFTDTAYYGTTSTPYLFKDKNTSSTADYFDSTGPIVSTVQWAATTLGAPYATKQARELHLHYRDLRERSGGALLTTYSIKTDIERGGQTVDAWSSADTFSTEQTIGGAVLPYQFRKLVPQNVQRATYYTLGLSASVASPGGYWALNGYSIVYEGTGERTGTVR